MAKKRSTLGYPNAQHAAKARDLIDASELALKSVDRGSCGMRLHGLLALSDSLAKARAHASGGKVAKGALVATTLPQGDAVRLYEALDKRDRAVERFREACVRDAEGALSGTRLGRRRR